MKTQKFWSKFSFLLLITMFILSACGKWTDVTDSKVFDSNSIKEEENKQTETPFSFSEIICGKTNPLYCEKNEDCVCADDQSGYPGCFTGNREYYIKCEDKSLSCTDHCSGWGQPQVKCIENKCTNSYKK